MSSRSQIGGCNTSRVVASSWCRRSRSSRFKIFPMALCRVRRRGGPSPPGRMSGLCAHRSSRVGSPVRRLLASRSCPSDNSSAQPTKSVISAIVCSACSSCGMWPAPSTISSREPAIGGLEVLAVRRVDEPVLGAPHEKRRCLHPVQALGQPLVRQRPDELQDAGHRLRRPEQRLRIGRVGRRQRADERALGIGEHERRQRRRRDAGDVGHRVVVAPQADRGDQHELVDAVRARWRRSRRRPCHRTSGRRRWPARRRSESSSSL